MTTLFQQVFKNIIGHEGGYVNHPADPGGETKFGISKRSYPDENIKAMTLERAEELYFRDFWTPLKCDKLHPALAEFVFDFGVNSGMPTAAKAVQKAVGALPDGNIGPKTLALISSRPARDIARLVFVSRMKIMARHQSYETFADGWGARLFDVTEHFVQGVAK